MGGQGPAELEDHDNRILLRHVLGLDSGGLITARDRELTQQEISGYCRLVDLRVAGSPIAYLTGNREFWSLELVVDERVLIPRHETETLVERVLARIVEFSAPLALELGTGSGAVAVALATEMPDVGIVATDISRGALEVAGENIRRVGVRNVELMESDWYRELSGRKFHLICSNPPYIDPEDEHLGQGDLRFEPQSALVSANSGLSDLEIIVSESRRFLESSGWLVLEHGYQQGVDVRRLFADCGLSRVMTWPDLSGNDRVTEGQYLP